MFLTGFNKSPNLWLANLCVLAALGGCTTLSAGQAGAPLALANGVLAGEIGAGLSDAARQRAASAELRALETGQTGLPVSWKVSEGVFGTVTPQQPYSVGATNCRRYTHSVTSDGVSRSATGTACRSADGKWEPLA